MRCIQTSALVRQNTQLTRHALSHACWGRVHVTHPGLQDYWAVVVPLHLLGLFSSTEVKFQEMLLSCSKDMTCTDEQSILQCYLFGIFCCCYHYSSFCACYDTLQLLTGSTARFRLVLSVCSGMHVCVFQLALSVHCFISAVKKSSGGYVCVRAITQRRRGNQMF